MTEEDFLKRWSRRKREVAKAEAEPLAEAKSAEPRAHPQTTQKAEPEFDLASLPPIESINALTDVTAFLRAGVPADLTRAALRRVWTADPAIRNFVGLAENAWDFTDPNAMPGFGPLESTEEVRQMIANLVDKIGEAAQGGDHTRETAVQSLGDSNALGGEDVDDGRTQIVTAPAQEVERVAEVPQSQVLLQSSKVITAPQHDAAEAQPESAQSSRRSHGGALPR